MKTSLPFAVEAFLSMFVRAELRSQMGNFVSQSQLPLLNPLKTCSGILTMRIQAFALVTLTEDVHIRMHLGRRKFLLLQRLVLSFDLFFQDAHLLCQSPDSVSDLVEGVFQVLLDPA
eukprot:CAMPEP_0181397488 /NCGR_PEP_ID=MMETSP1110-20121109/511_1 /TAXON_ID=174948 /ORGANISM="Symbiodinium sp., Strain CCMP421" /LENGTH=116 /DNA_ID=CAMNT_0023519329 /DNA_START=242 /DNA_END=593 /DNA_ORIENTATION=-